jgi:hypothetical protein
MELIKNGRKNYLGIANPNKFMKYKFWVISSSVCTPTPGMAPGVNLRRNYGVYINKLGRLKERRKNFLL